MCWGVGGVHVKWNSRFVVVIGWGSGGIWGWCLDNSKLTNGRAFWFWAAFYSTYNAPIKNLSWLWDSGRWIGPSTSRIRFFPCVGGWGDCIWSEIPGLWWWSGGIWGWCRDNSKLTKRWVFWLWAAFYSTVEIKTLCKIHHFGQNALKHQFRRVFS